MSTRRDPHYPADTHEVVNQPPPLENVNLFDGDLALVEGLRREGGGWAEAQVRSWGAELGLAESIELGRLANRCPPELRSHDRFGHRIDEVEFHPAWHRVMGMAMAQGVHNLPWRHPQPGAHVARTAMHAMLSQIESGACCPLTMTFASFPTLRQQPELAREWEERMLGSEYDPRMVPAEQKSAVLIGMAMTEKQGGSDVRANTTRARSLGKGGPGAEYELVGHKWFCSAPMSDAFLALAQTREKHDAPSCFLVPRWRPDGTRNPIHLQRLKDKLGNRSNASSEIEFAGSWARMIGEEGRGVHTILEMVHHTRLDCVSGSAGLMRQALAQASHHVAHRSAFGRRLVEHPLMMNVVADLALESEAATALMLRLARAYDEAAGARGERALARIATAVAKYWVCKRTPQMIYEAMECLGGNGYVEESNLARLYREAPVNAIWEGAGNVICLDVLRAMRREPETISAFLGELSLAAGGNPRLDARVTELEADLSGAWDDERVARRLVERMALALQASLLVRGAPAYVADAFCASRLEGDAGLLYGTLPSGAALREIIERAAPRLSND
ncbi:MAG: isovaleryl-CoA dehydrogenase [Myxococcota bacterium]